MVKRTTRLDRIRHKLAAMIRPDKTEKDSFVRLGFEPSHEPGTKTLRTMQEMSLEDCVYFMANEDRKALLRNQLAHGLLPAVAHELQISAIYDLDREVYIVLGDITITKESTPKKEDKNAERNQH